MTVQGATGRASLDELEIPIEYLRSSLDPDMWGIYLQRGRMAQAAEVPFGGTLTSDTAVVTLISTGE